MNIKELIKRTNNLTPLETQYILNGIQSIETVDGCPCRLSTEEDGTVRCIINRHTMWFIPSTMSDILSQIVEKRKAMSIRSIIFRSHAGEYYRLIISILAPYRASKYNDCGLEAIEKLYNERLALEEQVRAQKAKQERLREERRAAHHRLLHSKLDENMSPIMILERVNTQYKYELKAIYWAEFNTNLLDAAKYACHCERLPGEIAARRMYAHDYAGGGGFYPIGDTNYVLYGCAPKRKRNPCRCGKDSYEEDGQNYSLIDGVEFGDYYCEYCFFDKNSILVSDDFLASPVEYFIGYTEEYKEKEAKRLSDALDEIHRSCIH